MVLARSPACRGSIGVPMMCAKPYGVTWAKGGTNYRIYRIPCAFQPAMFGESTRNTKCLGEA
jgi:hypothetical protein